MQDFKIKLATIDVCLFIFWSLTKIGSLAPHTGDIVKFGCEILFSFHVVHNPSQSQRRYYSLPTMHFFQWCTGCHASRSVAKDTGVIKILKQVLHAQFGALFWWIRGSFRLRLITVKCTLYNTMLYRLCKRLLFAKQGGGICFPCLPAYAGLVFHHTMLHTN